jgi:hypothetical protein
VPIPSDSVEIDLGAGTAEYTLLQVPTLDFGTFVNDIAHGSSVPVTISFTVQWGGVKKHFNLRDAATGFRGAFVATAATMECSVSEARLTFVSDDASTSSAVSAVIGEEHNGVFF